MSHRASASDPRPEMVNAVAEMLRNLEQICPDPSIIGRCPELPGVVLDKVWATCLDRDGPEYAKVNSDFKTMRAEYFKALVAHPVGRSLALLAVGPDGVAMLELGRPPAFVTEARAAPGARTRTRRDSYNCHHILPKSVRPESSSTLTNHPTNFVVAKTTRHGRDQSENPHHFWHSLLLHPQTHNAPAEPIPLYVVRPLFPFYPPITQGFHTAEELRKKLASLGAPPLPEIWEQRLLEFSKASKHRPYVVPKEFHEITQMFGDLFKTRNKDPDVNRQLRSGLAAKGAQLAAEYLPAGAYVNGQPLPAGHTPKRSLPVIESNRQPDPPLQKPSSPRKSRSTKRHLPKPVVQPQPIQQKV